MTDECMQAGPVQATHKAQRCKPGTLYALVVGRDKASVELLASQLAGHACLTPATRVMNNGHSDPLYGVEPLPDLLVLVLSRAWRDELEALTLREGAQRPAVLVAGPAGDTPIMRLAMHAGARDFLTLPLVPAELDSAVRLVVAEADRRVPGDTRLLLAFVNAKGGSGASLLAANVAHVLALRTKVVLVDLDLQFGTLPLYLDLVPKRGVLEALEDIEYLDALALDAHLVKHAGGLRVLGTVPGGVALPAEVPPERLEQLLDMLALGFEQIVVDLPRQIDHLTSIALERASKVAVVVQQSTTQLRDATRLMGILREELALTREHIAVVVNRYDKRAGIGLAEITRALGDPELLVVPNDLRQVMASINAGVPLYDQAPSAAITRALVQLAERLGCTQHQSERGWVSRSLGRDHGCR